MNNHGLRFKIDQWGRRVIDSPYLKFPPPLTEAQVDNLINEHKGNKSIQVPEGYITFVELAKLTGSTLSKLKYIRDKYKIKWVRVGKYYAVKKDKMIQAIEESNQPALQLPEGFILKPEALAILGRSAYTLESLVSSKEVRTTKALSRVIDKNGKVVERIVNAYCFEDLHKWSKEHNQTETQDFITVAMAAKLVKVSTSTVRNWCHRSAFPFIIKRTLVGRQTIEVILVDKKAFMNWVRQNKSNL